jgi:hypothetical protein
MPIFWKGRSNPADGDVVELRFQRLGRAPTSHNALIDLVDCLLHQPDCVFAMSTFVVFGLLKLIDGLLEIVSGVEHVLLERIGRPTAQHPES